MKDMTLEHSMNDTKKSRAKVRNRNRARLRACVVAVALAMGTQNAYAGYPVIDITSIMGELRSWWDDTIEYAKEATRWTQIKQQIDEVRAIFDAFNYVMNLPTGQPMKKVAPNYLVAESCGQNSSGFSFKSVLSVVGITGEDIKTQQTQICVNIRMIQNQKYNDTVDFLDKTVKEAQEAMLENFMKRASSNKGGGVQAADSDTLRLGNELNMMGQQWATKMQAYDAYIAGQQENQNILAKAALKGNPKNKMLGDLVQTIALKGALSVD
jgi:hypothetical protein